MLTQKPKSIVITVRDRGENKSKSITVYDFATIHQRARAGAAFNKLPRLGGRWAKIPQGFLRPCGSAAAPGMGARIAHDRSFFFQIEQARLTRKSVRLIQFLVFHDEVHRFERFFLFFPREVWQSFLLFKTPDHLCLFARTATNVGSLEGLIALGRGNSHLAGCHLFDPDTGEYNFPYIARYLPGMNSSVVNLVYRDNGLMVKSGNPLHIDSIEDLGRPGIKIINRQKVKHILRSGRLVIQHWYLSSQKLQVSLFFGLRNY